MFKENIVDRTRKYQISKPNVKVQIEKPPAVKIETKTATPQPVQLAKNDQKFKLNVDFDHKEPIVSNRDKNDDTPPLPPPQPLKDTNEASHKNFDITFRVPNVHHDSEKNKENTPPPDSARTLISHASEKHTEKHLKAPHDDDEPLISVRTDHSQGVGLTLNHSNDHNKPLISVGGKAHDEHEKAPVVEAKHDEHADQHKPFLSMEHNQHEGVDILLNNHKVSSV